MQSPPSPANHESKQKLAPPRQGECDKGKFRSAMTRREVCESKKYSPSKAGRGVTFLKLAGARRRRWLMLGEFAKYAFCGLKRKRRDFERSVLKYVSIKIPALTHSGRKSRVCVNALDRLTPPPNSPSLTVLFPPHRLLCAASIVQNRCTRASRLQIPA